MHSKLLLHYARRLCTKAGTLPPPDLRQLVTTEALLLVRGPPQPVWRKRGFLEWSPAAAAPFVGPAAPARAGPLQALRGGMLRTLCAGLLALPLALAPPSPCQQATWAPPHLH